MATILSGTKLLDRLRVLVDQSERIDIAVAWVTPSVALDQILSLTSRFGKDSVRILAGVGGYITHPAALESIQLQANLHIFGEPKGQLFHPKLYIYHTNGNRICWVGSPNLTGPAFEQNEELVAEFTDLDGSILSHFVGLWESKKSSKEFDLIAYKKGWEKQSKKRPQFLNREAGLTSEVISPPDVLVAGWDKFLSEIRRTEDLPNSILTVQAGYDFVRRDWEQDLDDLDFNVMLGKKPFSHFGKITRIPKKLFAGDSDDVRKKRIAIGRALNTVIQMNQLNCEILVEAFNTLVGLKGCGHALATRLLLFARPDCCVVVNKRSFRYLAKQYDLVSFSRTPTGAQYAALIQALQKQGWWKSPAPSTPDDLKIWSYRTALTDRFAFEDYESRG